MVSPLEGAVGRGHILELVEITAPVVCYGGWIVQIGLLELLNIGGIPTK